MILTVGVLQVCAYTTGIAVTAMSATATKTTLLLEKSAIIREQTKTTTLSLAMIAPLSGCSDEMTAVTAADVAL